MQRIRNALHRPRSRVFNIEVQSGNRVTHRLKYRSALPFTVAELLGLLQNEPDRLAGVLVAADDRDTRLGPSERLDPAQTYVLLHSGQGRRWIIEQMLALTLRQTFQPASSCSTQDGSDHRARAVQYYYGQPYDPRMQLREMLTGHIYPAEELTATHIYRKQWDHILDLTGVTKHDERNLLLLHQKAEERLDRQEWTILPRGRDQFQVYVLRPGLLDNKGMESHITGKRGVRWSEVHLQMLAFTDCVSGSRPARRVCGIHAAAAIFHAEDKGWIPVGQISVPEEAWESDGYDRELMQAFLSGKHNLASSDAS